MKPEQARDSFNPPGTFSLGRDASREPASAAATALAVYTFLVIGRITEFFPSLRLTLLMSGVIIGLVLFLPRPKGPGFLQHPEVRAALALLVLAVVTIPFSMWPGRSFDFVVNGYLKTVSYFILFVYCVRSRHEVDRLMWGFLWAIFALQVTILVSSKVVVTETYDPNDTAFVMLCAMPLAIFLSVKEQGVRKYLAGAIGILAIFTIVLTRSRGGFVGLVIIGALLLIRLPSRQRHLKAVFLLGSILLFGVFASGTYWDRIATIWGGGGVTTTDYEEGGFEVARWEIWKGGFRLMLENPLLGVGAGAFEVAEGSLHQGVGKWNAPHNSFIQVGAELGVGGLVLFVFLIYRAVKNCRTVIRLARNDSRLQPYLCLGHGFEISLSAYIVAGSALSQGYTSLLYFLIGMSVVLKGLIANLEAPDQIAKGAPR